MLVLARRKLESIEITDSRTQETVRVSVVDIRGEKVRLGVDAPIDYVVDREEIADAKRAEIAPRSKPTGRDAPSPKRLCRVGDPWAGAAAHKRRHSPPAATGGLGGEGR